MKNEKGFTLIEVMIAIALLGIIAVAFLGALATASRALVIADERATAESLARSQMEYVKNQDYKDADIYNPYDPGPPPTGGEVTYAKITGIPAGYTIWGVDRADATVTDIIGVPWDSLNNQPVTTDVGLQRIKVIIQHHGKDVITLEDYKVDR